MPYVITDPNMDMTIDGDFPDGDEDMKRDVLALAEEVLSLLHQHFPVRDTSTSQTAKLLILINFCHFDSLGQFLV